MSQLATDLLANHTAQRAAKTISDRLSQELVIALVGPVGSGFSTTAILIEQTLRNEYGYLVAPIIKPSDIIRTESHRIGVVISKDSSTLETYIDQMQTTGNALRKKFGNDYLAQKIIEKIVLFRTEIGGYTKENVQIPGRRAYIIDSLKNTEELDLLRQVYGDTCCVIGVFAPDAQRKQRLVHAGASEDDVRKIMDRDQGEVSTFGQKTRKIFTNSQFFLRNDRKREELEGKIRRFLDLIFNINVHTPTRAEAAMFNAAAAAAKSACMSRQVGAVIISKDGEAISVGWNDVPRFGGGLYDEDDQFTFDKSKSAIIDKDNRCFKWGGCICHNETRKNSIVSTISERIANSKFVKKGTKKSDILSILEGTAIDSIIEYSRSIHAEMEAILAVAREGRHSLVGSSLYTTTYPCHNCARHIVASGISKVYYIEPYLKSLATDLHKDAVTEDTDDEDKVVFCQFDGVAPKIFLRLFRPEAERKEAGRARRAEPKIAMPTFRIALDSQVDYESKVIADLSSREERQSQ